METNRVRPHWGVTCLAVLPMVAVVFLSALSIQKPADWSQDRLMLSAIINLERLETRNGSNGQLQAYNTFAQRPLR